MLVPCHLGTVVEPWVCRQRVRLDALCRVHSDATSGQGGAGADSTTPAYASPGRGGAMPPPPATVEEGPLQAWRRATLEAVQEKSGQRSRDEPKQPRE